MNLSYDDYIIGALVITINVFSKWIIPKKRHK